jgi:hypothetical protein
LRAQTNFIPGAEGETEPGKRRLNWVWYWNVPEAELPELMTGVDGRERDFSVPPGQVRDGWLKKQGAIAENVFCPQFLDLWYATKTPFLQPILDLAVPRMLHGRFFCWEIPHLFPVRTLRPVPPKQRRMLWHSGVRCSNFRMTSTRH